MKSALVTGGAGFIGSHVVDSLLADGWRVTALDNFDAFYAREVKLANLAAAQKSRLFELVEADVREPGDLRRLPDGFEVIVHLAAKAGVRPSIADPVAYQEANVGGTLNLLEFARERGVRQFVFASSSSVYGVNPRTPWREDDPVLLPISPYAATKVGGELLGHVYSRLHGIRFLALRFFTVYGPRQRPDLAIHKFARLILDGAPVPVFGDGGSRRDYTFITDIMAGIRAAVEYRATPYEVINLGNSRTVSLREMIRELEAVLGREAVLDRRPEQAGDVPVTYAAIGKAGRLLGYAPRTPLRQGLECFADWLRAHGPPGRDAQGAWRGGVAGESRRGGGQVRSACRNHRPGGLSHLVEGQEACPASKSAQVNRVGARQGKCRGRSRDSSQAGWSASDSNR